jgi:transposase-like protein
MSRERKYYTKEFKERVLVAYDSSEESASEIARRFQVNLDTVKSWVYRKRTALPIFPAGSILFAESAMHLMRKNEKLSSEEMEIRIKELEQQLAIEKMRSESFVKRIEIAERELKIDIRKKSGARPSLR